MFHVLAQIVIFMATRVERSARMEHARWRTHNGKNFINSDDLCGRLRMVRQVRAPIKGEICGQATVNLMSLQCMRVESVSRSLLSFLWHQMTQRETETSYSSVECTYIPAMVHWSPWWSNPLLSASVGSNNWRRFLQFHVFIWISYIYALCMYVISCALSIRQ